MSVDNRPTLQKKVPSLKGMPQFPRVEGGRDFDEEVEDRIRLTHAYNNHIAESNSRALSDRGNFKTAEIEGSSAMSMVGIDTTNKKKKKKSERKKTMAITNQI